MIIIYKITDYFPESNRIAVKFCREKSSKPIDEYNAVAINFEDIDKAKEIFNKILDDEISNKMPLDIIEVARKSFDERLFVSRL